MKRLRWLTAGAVAAIHEELISRYGGVPGVREAGLLESAIARPQHLAAYTRNLTVPALAAAYGWGLLRNDLFVDGNKRIALAAMVVFLDLNGWELTCSPGRRNGNDSSRRRWRDQRTHVDRVGRAQRKEEGLREWRAKVTEPTTCCSNCPALAKTGLDLS